MEGAIALPRAFKISENVHFNPADAGGRRHPRGAEGGGHKVAPLTSHAISPQRVNVETRNFVHTYLNA